MKQKIKILLNLLKSYPLVDAVRNGKNNLLLACEAKDTLGAIVFLQCGADPNQIWPNNVTPLTRAVKNEDYGMMHALLNHKADPNKPDKNSQTPLFIACNNDSASAVDLLLERGANPIYALKEGKTPLNKTLQMQSWGLTAKLLSRVTNFSLVPSEDLVLLRLNKQNVLTAMHKIFNKLPFPQRNNLERFAKSWGCTLERRTNMLSTYSLFPRSIHLPEIKQYSVYRPRF